MAGEQARSGGFFVPRARCPCGPEDARLVLWRCALMREEAGPVLRGGALRGTREPTGAMGWCTRRREGVGPVLWRGRRRAARFSVVRLLCARGCCRWRWSRLGWHASACIGVSGSWLWLRTVEVFGLGRCSTVPCKHGARQGTSGHTVSGGLVFWSTVDGSAEGDCRWSP